MNRSDFPKLLRRVQTFAACVAFLLASSTVARANPPNIPAGSKLVYNFNVIGYPAGKRYDGDCGGGHRIFVNRDATGAQVLAPPGIVRADPKRRFSSATLHGVCVRIVAGGKMSCGTDTM